MEDTAPTPVRITPHERIACEWELVLIAAGIPCRVERREREWVLVVAPDEAARARRELAEYDEERAGRSPNPPAFPEYGPSWLGAGFAVLLVAFASLTGTRSESPELFRAGHAHAAAILDGEWWRTVTALTLHADASHLVANLVIGAVVATLVSWSVGPGVGAWMFLLSGAAGNGLTAWTYGTAHHAVGASTAVFGGIGALAGFAVVRGRRRAWIPLAAGLALLGFLGSSERADLFAHLFGFVAGVAVGVPIAPLAPTRSRPIQGLLALAAVLAICVCWALAAGHERS
jgi:rhomboid protease GluP